MSLSLYPRSSHSSCSEHPPTDHKLASDHGKRGTPSQLWESGFIVPFSTRVFTCASPDAGALAAVDGLVFDENVHAWYTVLSSDKLLQQLQKWGLRPPCTRTVMELVAAQDQLLISPENPQQIAGHGVEFYIDVLRAAPFSLHVSDAMCNDVYHYHVLSVSRMLEMLLESDRRNTLRPKLRQHVRPRLRRRVASESKWQDVLNCQNTGRLDYDEESTDAIAKLTSTPHPHANTGWAFKTVGDDPEALLKRNDNLLELHTEACHTVQMLRLQNSELIRTLSKLTELARTSRVAIDSMWAPSTH